MLSAAPAIGKVPGSGEFAARYNARFGPIQNYAASSCDSARIVMSAIEAGAKAKGGPPTRADVLAALKGLAFQGVAYAAPVVWDAKGDARTVTRSAPSTSSPAASTGSVVWPAMSGTIRRADTRSARGRRLRRLARR